MSIASRSGQCQWARTPWAHTPVSAAVPMAPSYDMSASLYQDNWVRRSDHCIWPGALVSARERVRCMCLRVASCDVERPQVFNATILESDLWRSHPTLVLPKAGATHGPAALPACLLGKVWDWDWETCMCSPHGKRRHHRFMLATGHKITSLDHRHPPTLPLQPSGDRRRATVH